MTVRVAIAVAALVRDGRVLMAHRHPRRQHYPNCWDLVGGHIEPGERADDAVRRECFEELGIRIGDVEPIPFAVSDLNLDVHAFRVTRWHGDPVNAAPDEHDDLRWCRPDELANLVLAHRAGLPDIQAALRGHAG